VVEDVNHEGGCPLIGSSQPILRACMDVYEWEAQGTGSCEAPRAVAEGGCLYLLSTGQDEYPAQLADASADGSDAYFFARSRLVGQDEDQLLDVYDARVLGGLAAQNQPPPPVPCEAEGCKGPASARPEPSSPGSAAFLGPGNPAPRCGRGKVRRRGRCVKKHRRVRHGKADRRKR